MGRGGGLVKMNIAFSLLSTLQVADLFFGVPRIFDRDCNLVRIFKAFIQRISRIKKPPNCFSVKQLLKQLLQLR